jgi:hypothetical protein
MMMSMPQMPISTDGREQLQAPAKGALRLYQHQTTEQINHRQAKSPTKVLPERTSALQVASKTGDLYRTFDRKREI